MKCGSISAFMCRLWVAEFSYAGNYEFSRSPGEAAPHRVFGASEGDWQVCWWAVRGSFRKTPKGGGGGSVHIVNSIQF